MIDTNESEYYPHSGGTGSLFKRLSIILTVDVECPKTSRDPTIFPSEVVKPDSYQLLSRHRFLSIKILHLCANNFKRLFANHEEDGASPCPKGERCWKIQAVLGPGVGVFFTVLDAGSFPTGPQP